MATVIVKEWDGSGDDPTGSVHLASHPSYSQIVASGTTSSGLLNFGQTFITDGVDVSASKCVTVEFVDFADANETVENVKMWVDQSDVPSGSYVMMEESAVWQQNKYFRADADAAPSASGAKVSMHRRGTESKTFFAESDAHTSNFMYFALRASGTASVGVYGGTLGGLSLELSYDVNTENGNRD